MNSPFTDLTELSNEETVSLNENGLENYLYSPFTRLKDYHFQSENINTDNLVNNYVTGAELSSKEIITAVKLNNDLMKDVGIGVGLGWGNYMRMIQNKFVELGMLANGSTFDLSKAPELLSTLIAVYQDKKGLRPTNKGSMAIGTWSAMQNDLKLIKISEPRIAISTHVIEANIQYSEKEHWKEYRQNILDYFASPAMNILTAGLPVDNVYFALAVSEWQKKKGFSGRDVDGILGPFSWKILKADLVTGYTNIHYTINIDTTEKAAGKFTQLMNDLEFEMYTQFKYIQDVIFVKMDIDENAEDIDTVSIGMGAIFSIIGAVPNPWFLIGSAMASGLLSYFKEDQEKKQRAKSLGAKLRLIDIINNLQIKSWFNTDKELIQTKLDQELAIVKRNGADSQAEFGKFLKYLQNLEDVIKNPDNVLQSAISSLIGSISKHTKVIVNCDNTQVIMNDWNDDNIIEVAKRQQIKIRFSKIHPQVSMADYQISPQEATILTYAWKLWQDKGYALKYLAVDKHIFFRAYPKVIFLPYRGFTYEYTINVFVKTLKPGETWINVNDIEGRDNVNIFFENLYIWDRKAVDSVRSTRGINELNSQGKSFLKIILYVVNNVMSYSYNTMADIKKVELLEYESGNFINNEQQEETCNNEIFSYNENSKVESEAASERALDEYQSGDVFIPSSNELFNGFHTDPVKGTTDYLNVSAVKGRSLKTGIFIPASFTKSANINVVLYLHGMFADGDKATGVDSYWNSYSNIRKHFYASGKNAILIAPGLNKDPQNSSVFGNGLDSFLDACLTELKAKSYVLSTSAFSQIILAAHSAGGKPLGIILNSSSKYVNNIVECWGFDCLYADGWAKLINNWATGNKIFYHYWAWSCSAGNLDKCPRVIGEKYQKLNPSNFKSIDPKDKTIHHQQVIEDAWINKINSRPWFGTSIVSVSPPVQTAAYGDTAAVYSTMNLEGIGLSFDAFRVACNGYRKLSQNSELPNNRILSVVDFTQSSKKRRLYILDMVDQRVLINTNVAHGHNGTMEWATKFSNKPGSKMSNLGFYITQETYKGRKNGLSLRIKGLEKGFNDNARARAVVVHSASYVHEDGNVGRSWGCPVVPPNRRDEVINTIKEGTCLFLYYNDANYLSKSLLAGDPPQTSQENYLFNDYKYRQSWLNENESQDENEEPDYMQENYEEESAANFYFESEDPLPVDSPSENPVPFAPLPPAGSFWPILTKAPEGRLVSYVTADGKTIGSPGRKFLANRETSSGEPRHHVGIDLYAKFNDPVIACDNGKILSFNHFYTTNGGNDTNSLVVQHSNVIINYGEVGTSSLGRLNLHVGDTVKAGQVIAFIGATGMLHFEVYKIINGTRDLPPHRWMKADSNPPATLCNPTKYLLYLKQYGLEGLNKVATSVAPVSPSQWNNAIRLNRYYADKLGWNQYYDKINDFLLPFSGQQNVSLGEEDFAQAIAAWQKSKGFASKNCDGIIGPASWKQLSVTIHGSSSVSSTIPASSFTGNTIEPVPATFSLDKVPAGFKQSSYSIWHGLDKKSATRVDEAAKKINTIIPLTGYGITETDVDTFQRLANAETGGHVQNFYSLDMAIVSIGFRQFTFIHGNIHNWIEKAPAAFKRYGIEIDYSLPPYIIRRSKGNYTVKRIKGVDDPETLRWDGWAQRFYYAALDYEIIIAEFVLAKEYFAKELSRLKRFLKSDSAFSKFTGYYNQSAHIRAFFHELNNAAPKYVPSITQKALAKVSPDETVDRYFTIYLQTAKENWPDADQVQRIFEKTSSGATVKVFENEFNYEDASEEDGTSYDNELMYEDVTEEDGSSYDNEFNYEDALEEDGSSYDEISVYETSQQEFRPAEHKGEFDLFTKDWSNAIRLNQHYAEKLGWRQFHDKINDILLPLSGQQNVSLGEEAFAEALSSWQQQHGISSKDADGILGPKTWSLIQPLVTTSNASAPNVSISVSSSTAQTEWSNNPNIQARYLSWQLYKAKRDEVVSWGVANPAPYIEAAIQEWNANPIIHSHFNNGLDGNDARSSYLNLKRLYEAKGITNAASYFATNIVTINFFNRSTPAHRDLQQVLSNAQSNLVSSGNNFTFISAWSFVPRTFNRSIHKLSNHALGRAIDINPTENPHIVTTEEIKVINAACATILPNGLLAETNPDILRNASNTFQITFNNSWLAGQPQAIRNAAADINVMKNLKNYAAIGFLNLPSALIRGLQSAGLSWGGAWKSAKDFMHFELP